MASEPAKEPLMEISFAVVGVNSAHWLEAV
jgi:hypothetical protein